MKYLMFGGAHHYPSGGMEDFLGISTMDLESTKKDLVDLRLDWVQILDVATSGLWTYEEEWYKETQTLKGVWSFRVMKNTDGLTPNFQEALTEDYQAQKKISYLKKLCRMLADANVRHVFSKRDLREENAGLKEELKRLRQKN